MFKYVCILIAKEHTKLILYADADAAGNFWRLWSIAYLTNILFPFIGFLNNFIFSFFYFQALKKQAF